MLASDARDPPGRGGIRRQRPLPEGPLDLAAPLARTPAAELQGCGRPPPPAAVDLAGAQLEAFEAPPARGIQRRQAPPALAWPSPGRALAPVTVR